MQKRFYSDILRTVIRVTLFLKPFSAILGSRSSNLPSVTNRKPISLCNFSLADGLREDTVFVSKLPQNIDHEVMKSHFGTIGKIKVQQVPLAICIIDECQDRNAHDMDI